MTDRQMVEIRLENASPSFVVTGRNAWALLELISAGESGCTPIENPAPRWSAYVFNLRRVGIAIETLREQHGGAYPGTHARYVLKVPVEIVEVSNGAT